MFLATHFGHNAKSKWRLTRDIYGALGTKMWTWEEVTRDMAGFRNWLAGAEATLRGGDGVHRAFGNHRKYTSLDAWKPNATGDAIASYVAWIQRNGGHQAMLVDALTASLGDPGAAFDRSAWACPPQQLPRRSRTSIPMRWVRLLRRRIPAVTSSSAMTTSPMGLWSAGRWPMDRVTPGTSAIRPRASATCSSDTWIRSWVCSCRWIR